jgi:hypothetical protein
MPRLGSRRHEDDRRARELIQFWRHDDGRRRHRAWQLTANVVTLWVNSEARAARGQTLLEPVLTALVRAPLSSGRPSNRWWHRRATGRVRRTPFVFHPTKSATSFTKASRIASPFPLRGRRRRRIVIKLKAQDALDLPLVQRLRLSGCCSTARERIAVSIRANRRDFLRHRIARHFRSLPG